MQATPLSPAPAGLALTVDLLATPGGVVELAASDLHRVKIHAGDPVTGTCGQSRFVYRRGDVDILPAGTSDAWEEDQPSTSLMVELSALLVRRAADELGLPAGRGGVEPRHQIRDPQIEHIGWALDAERRAGHPGGRLLAESLGLALAFHLLGRYPAPRPVVVGLSAPRRRRVEAYIEEHLDRSLSLLVLAEVAGLGTTQFKLQFKRSMGVAVHEYVMRRRVERARALLVADAMPAGQVALAAGFAHQSHMARWMRRVLGVTPRAMQLHR
jgi:AraC family transcriptional regulator